MSTPQERPRIVIGAGRFKDDDPEVKHFGPQDSIVASFVLEHSIRRECPQAEIINTYAMAKPQMRPPFRNPTPFSLVRFWVPELLSYAGWAIYLDSDMIVTGDIRELWALARADGPAVYSTRMTTGCTAVMLLDCERLVGWNASHFAKAMTEQREYSDLHKTHFHHDGEVGNIPACWNHRDICIPGETKLVHFTNLAKQPWNHRDKHPLERLWLENLLGAVARGEVNPETVRAVHPDFYAAHGERILGAVGATVVSTAPPGQNGEPDASREESASGAGSA